MGPRSQHKLIWRVIKKSTGGQALFLFVKYENSYVYAIVATNRFFWCPYSYGMPITISLEMECIKNSLQGF